MEQFENKVFEKVELWLIVGELGSSKLYFDDAKVILTDNNLIVSQNKEDGELYKIFKLNELAGFKLKIK